jgi:hypothetical protein
MQVLFKRSEIESGASLINVFVSYVNQVSLALEEDVSAFDALKVVENWLNDKLGSRVQDDKIVKIDVTMFGNVKLTIDPEFVGDFFNLYGELVVVITPHVVGFATSLCKFTPKIDAFVKRWDDNVSKDATDDLKDDE